MSGRSSGAVWTMLLLPPLLLGGLIVAYAAWQGLSPTDPASEAAVREGLPLIIAVNHTLLFGVLVWLLRRRGKDLGDLGWSLADRDTTVIREVALGLACGLALYLLKELAVDSIRALAAGNTPTFTTLFRFRPSLLDRDMAVVAGTLVFVEESIYRGYALPHFRARRGTAVAVAVTSVAFGLLHWGNGLEAILFSTVWGVLLAAVFLWRRNLLAPTVAHGLYNLFVLLASS